MSFSHKTERIYFQFSYYRLNGRNKGRYKKFSRTQKMLIEKVTSRIFKFSTILDEAFYSIENNMDISNFIDFMDYLISRFYIPDHNIEFISALEKTGGTFGDLLKLMESRKSK